MPWNKDYDNPGITEEEATAVIIKARELAPLTFSPYRDLWAPFFATLWYTGRRESEILAVSLQDVGHQELRYTPAKTKVPRPTLCYIPIRLAQDLVAIAQGRHLKPDARIFPMTKQAVAKTLNRLAKAAGIPRHVHPHMFRHGHAHHLATNMQKQGVNPDVIQGAVKGALNHKSWAYSKVYLEPSKGELMDFQRRTFRR